MYEGGKDTVDSGKLSRRGKLEHDDHENEDGEGSSRKNVLKLSFSFIHRLHEHKHTTQPLNSLEEHLP